MSSLSAVSSGLTRSPALPIFLHKAGNNGLPEGMRRGRGAPVNQASMRFHQRDSVLDGDLFDLEMLEADAPSHAVPTTVMLESPRHAITRNTSPDIPFDRSLNAYRGCEHGCVYCYARPTHAYLDLSPGLDFETRLTAKQNMPELLAAEISKPAYKADVLAMGTNTDPYQPIERDYKITRNVLEVMELFGHPCSITTKNHLVTRDVDILSRLAEHDLVVVNISITTLDAKLARAMEPRASTPAKRLEAIRVLSEAGIRVNVFVSPVIPGLNDHEIERILEAAKEAGATGASSIHLRLPHEVKDIFKSWLQDRVPDRADRVMNQVKAMRSGRDNDPRFFNRMSGSGVYAELLRARFNAACVRLGLTRDRFQLRKDLFRVPGRRDQLDLFAA
jgi:DNA repair photolyase